MKMTTAEVYALLKEFKVEKAKTVKVPHYYKYRGEMHRRSYDDYIETPRYVEIRHMLFDDNGPTAIYKCSCCGEVKSVGHMEFWEDEEALSAYGTCSICYEDEMGEDL